MLLYVIQIYSFKALSLYSLFIAHVANHSQYQNPNQKHSSQEAGCSSSNSSSYRITLCPSPIRLSQSNRPLTNPSLDLSGSQSGPWFLKRAAQFVQSSMSPSGAAFSLRYSFLFSHVHVSKSRRDCRGALHVSANRSSQRCCSLNFISLCSCRVGRSKQKAASLRKDCHLAWCSLVSSPQTVKVVIFLSLEGFRVYSVQSFFSAQVLVAPSLFWARYLSKARAKSRSKRADLALVLS
ncbi:hypothetical protein FGO68_gene7834 [Halteria grandinella]|uniref:Uncharacterized protein n=1 Tax=Halteria grandinella TaxID=5974 RepID=A0A8J8SWE7_HALGN|nr:hypothetical protein FGO68_gene7834 [Halteria grandinella]